MKKLIPNSRLPDRYGVRRETIFKWKRDPRVGFPKPTAVIKGIEYFDPDELDEYDQASLASVTPSAAISRPHNPARPLSSAVGRAGHFWWAESSGITRSSPIAQGQ